LVHYDGGKFPFKDKAFDYVICSHVLEHIPPEELDSFLNEIQRISPRGYIEFPNIFYELINFQDVHKWFMNYRNGTILFLDKGIFSSNNVHKIIREAFFFGKDKYFFDSFKRHKDFFFVGFEWFEQIQYEIVSDYDALVNQSDYEFWKQHFSDYMPPPISTTKEIPLRRKFVLFAKRLILFFINYSKKKNKFFIDKTASIKKRNLVVINDFAEIKEYVIIRTYENPVVIGKYTQLNPFTVIYGASGVYIGENVMIAPHCMIASGNHYFKQLEKPMRFAKHITKGTIVIEDNVWIGANVTITDGVRIGKDAVVAANSVVTVDVAPFDIVAGVPAKVIGNRKNLATNAK
jgi:acetyltransferase-like isoleucine patch superfamily enzyme